MRFLVLLLLPVILAGCGPQIPKQGERMKLKNDAVELTNPDGSRLRYDGVYYDWVDAQGMRGMRLWTPPTGRPMRAILFHGNPGGSGDTRGISRDARLQEFAVRHDLGIIGVNWFPGREVYSETGAIMLDVLEQWARMGYHPEIRNIPLMPRGSSNAGVTAFSLLCLAPERMLCLTPNVGPHYDHAEVPDAALLVPAWMHIGPEDPFFENGMEATRELFHTMRPRGARWTWDAEQGKGHEIRHIDDVDMMFYEVCLNLRLPDGYNPLQGRPNMHVIPREEGWLVDLESRGEPLVYIAPWHKYQRDKDKAGWLPTQDLAFLYRAIATYDKPMDIVIEGPEPVRNPYSSGVYLRSVGGPVAEPGEQVTVRCKLLHEGFSYHRIVFYNGAEKIGAVKSGEEPAVRFTVDGGRSVYALSALALRDGEPVGVSFPAHFLVSDPTMADALDEHRRRAEPFEPLTMPLPQPGSRAAARAPVENLDHKLDTSNTLPAWALTTEQEKLLHRNGPTAKLWKRINSPESFVRMESSSGAEEAALSFRAAHSRRGLYLHCRIGDDGFVSPREGLADNLDIHIARESRAEVWASQPGPEHFVKAAALSLLRTGIQYQLPVVPRENGETTMAWNYGDPWDLGRKELPLSQWESDYGVTVRYADCGDGARAVQLFLPWDYLGHGERMRQPASGTRFALVLGYNDSEADSDDTEALRWPYGLDPWAFKATSEKTPRPWGDLLIAPEYSR